MLQRLSKHAPGLATHDHWIEVVYAQRLALAALCLSIGAITPPPAPPSSPPQSPCIGILLTALRRRLRAVIPRSSQPPQVQVCAVCGASAACAGAGATPCPPLRTLV